MKIAISGSMQFSQEMIDVGLKLKSLGHSVILPKDVEAYADGSVKQEDKWKAAGLIKGYYEEIKECDAVLVVNITKNSIDNYIGGNALIELAFGHVLGKKIYLLNPVPDMNYNNEIFSMTPVILNGKLETIT